MLYTLPFGELSSKFAKNCEYIIMRETGKELNQNYRRNF
jgi:hypothetical protein